MIVVLGMPRSGTSLMCQALERLGYDFGGPLVPADRANPWGYYERQDTTKILTSLLLEACNQATWLTPSELYLKNAEYGRMGTLVQTLRPYAQQPDFAWKCHLVPRLRGFFLGLWHELRIQPRYVNCLRNPIETYLSILEANQTHDKSSIAEERNFLGTWARYYTTAYDLNPAFNAWYSDWEVDAQKMLDDLANALGRPKVSAEGLVKCQKS